MILCTKFLLEMRMTIITLLNSGWGGMVSLSEERLQLSVFSSCSFWWSHWYWVWCTFGVKSTLMSSSPFGLAWNLRFVVCMSLNSSLSLLHFHPWSMYFYTFHINQYIHKIVTGACTCIYKTLTFHALNRFFHSSFITHSWKKHLWSLFIDANA